MQKGGEEIMRGKLWGLLVLTILFTFGWKGQAEASPEEKTYVYEDFEYTFDDQTGYIWILAYNGREKEITVPAEIDGKQVKYIKNLSKTSEFFSQNKRITKVNLPEGIEYLSGMDGFVCLKEIKIPESVKIIGGDAFDSCRKLESVNFPKGLEVIETGAFAHCRSLKEIQLPEGLKKIEDDVFFGCELITEVVVPSTVTEIGVEAFCDCVNLKKVKLPDGLELIPDRAFEGCEKLKSINLPKNLKEIELYAFRGTGLTQITIPSKVKEISWYAFNHCNKLKKITIKSKKIKEIGRGAFSYIHKKAVFDVPNKYIKKYKNMLIKSKSFKKKNVKVK